MAAGAFFTTKYVNYEYHNFYLDRITILVNAYPIKATRGEGRERNQFQVDVR